MGTIAEGYGNQELQKSYHRYNVQSPVSCKDASEKVRNLQNIITMIDGEIHKLENSTNFEMYALAAGGIFVAVGHACNSIVDGVAAVGSLLPGGDKNPFAAIANMQIKARPFAEAAGHVINGSAHKINSSKMLGTLTEVGAGKMGIGSSGAGALAAKVEHNAATVEGAIRNDKKAIVQAQVEYLKEISKTLASTSKNPNIKKIVNGVQALEHGQSAVDNILKSKNTFLEVFELHNSSAQLKKNTLQLHKNILKKTQENLNQALESLKNCQVESAPALS